MKILQRFKVLSIAILGIICLNLATVLYAEPGVKITSPADGTIVVPGEEIIVTVESIDDFVIKDGIVIVTLSDLTKVLTQHFYNLPGTFTFKIRQDAIGEGVILVSSKGKTGKIAEDKIKFICQPQATLQGLKTNTDKISVDLDWNGNITGFYPNYIFSVIGIYSDGVERDIKNAGFPAVFPITYESSNPSVVSIDDKGKVQVYKVGGAEIIVSSCGFSVHIPLVFESPRGIRPKEIIPPTTQIDIQPLANDAGWYNQDITITLRAKDNEGGSGIQEVDWRFSGKAKEDYVKGDSAVVAYGLEGVKFFSYWSRDKEGNEDDNKIELRLDKTPPQTIITTPANQAEYLLNQVVTANWTVTDSLSGVESSSATTPSGQVIDTAQAGAKDFKVSCQDKAGNAATSTVKYYIRYRYLGILAPLKADGTSVFIKLGRTVPFKFQLQDAHNSYVTTAQARIYLAKISNNVVGQEVEAISTSQATTGNLFRYSSQDNLYIFNLSTDTLTTGTWQARIELDDGTSKYVNFGLK